MLLPVADLRGLALACLSSACDRFVSLAARRAAFLALSSLMTSWSHSFAERFLVLIWFLDSSSASSRTIE